MSEWGAASSVSSVSPCSWAFWLKDPTENGEKVISGLSAMLPQKIIFAPPNTHFHTPYASFRLLFYEVSRPNGSD